MPLQFNKVNEGVEIHKASVQDITFAKHALAVIHVHDISEGKGALTLRQVAACDAYLQDKSDTLSFYVLCAFGRHLDPVYTRFLDTYCKEGYSTEVDAIVQAIRSASSI